MTDRDPQQEWRRKTLDYVRSINAYVADAKGGEDVGPWPEDPGREHLAEHALAAVRRANAAGDFAGLRDRWPPAHRPLIPLLEENGQGIPVVCLLDDGSVVARVGYGDGGRTVHIRGDAVTDVPDIGFFGRGPGRRYFAAAEANGVAVTDGWRGPRVALCPWPTGREDVPEGVVVRPLDGPPAPTRLVPFPDGKRVLLVSEEGVYVLSEAGARRLLPTAERLRHRFEDARKDDPDAAVSLYIDMQHGAVSPDGRLIAVGDQCSTHLVFDDRLERVASIGNRSEYPHHAAFSADGRTVALNSCHFYNGATVGVRTDRLAGMTTPVYEDDDRTTVLDDGARVYAATARGDEFVVGDAYGYVRAFGVTGERRWEQFVGSTVGDVDVSADGKTLTVSTCAGFLALFRLDAGAQAPHQIGDGGHLETRRWLFWKHEPAPLIW